MGADLPATVRAFIARHIASALDLDVLIAMRHADGPCTAAELARDLRANEAACTGALEKFTAAGLLRLTDGTYEYAPAADLGRAADELADTYARRRVRVIEFIYKRPSESVTAFADAFKFRKER